MIFQRFTDMIPTISKRIARKDKRDFPETSVTTNDGALAIGQRFFFEARSVSFAAKRYIRLAVPSIVGSLVE